MCVYIYIYIYIYIMCLELHTHACKVLSTSCWWSRSTCLQVSARSRLVIARTLLRDPKLHAVDSVQRGRVQVGIAMFVTTFP